MERAARSQSAKCMRSIEGGARASRPCACSSPEGPPGLRKPRPLLPPPTRGQLSARRVTEDIFNALLKSPHARVDTDKRRGFEGRACESCHGPAQKHTESASAEDILQPAKLAAGAADKICLGCHLNEPTHVGRLMSSHAKNQVPCVTCHKIHADGPTGLVPRGAEAINTQCASCHLNDVGAVSETESPQAARECR